MQNVIPGDFDRNGKLDLLVMSSNGARDSNLEMKLYLGSPDGLGMRSWSCPQSMCLTFRVDTSNPITLPPSALSQPIPLDASGKMKIDLLGFTASSSSSDNKISLWNNTRADGRIASTANLFDV